MVRARPNIAGPSRAVGEGRNIVSDGLNEEVWQAIVAMAVAAHAGDSDKWGAAARRTKSDGRTAAVYLRWLLGQTIVKRLATAKPSNDDLHSLAKSIEPQLKEIGRFDPHSAEQLLRELFASEPIESAPEGAYFIVYAGAILGLLLNSTPENELSAMRSYIVRKCAMWARRDPEKFGFLLPSTS